MKRHGGETSTIHDAVSRAAHLLPSQGPIGVFIHHNTLHAFEHLPFEEATVEAAKLFGTEPFMRSAWYRDAWKHARILDEDIDAVLSKETRDGGRRLFGAAITRLELRRRVLRAGRTDTEGANVDWLLTERGRGRRLRTAVPDEARVHLIDSTREALSKTDPERAFDDPLLARAGAETLALLASLDGDRIAIERACDARLEALPTAALWCACSRRIATRKIAGRVQPEARSFRLRDRLLAATGRDADTLVHEILIPLVAAFLDQGVAYAPMPKRELGFFYATREAVLGGPPLAVPLWSAFREHVRQQTARGATPETSLEESLAAMGHVESDWGAVIEGAALALPGWAGMLHRLELEPELAPHDAPPCRLVDFIAVRLMLDRLAAELIAREELGLDAPLADRLPAIDLAILARRDRSIAHADELETAFALFETAQFAGASAPDVDALTKAELEDVLSEIDRFDDLEQRKCWHLALERRHRLGVLGALATKRPTARLERSAQPKPIAQALLCIDEREESLRRHLEEADPQIETIGAAGFFGVAIAYRGIDDGYHAPLCPVVLKPAHSIDERPVSEEDRDAARYLGRRKLLGELRYHVHAGTRSLVRGWFATLGLGLVSLVPLSLRTFAPSLVTRVNKLLRSRFFPRPRTELALERTAEEAGSLALFPGFTKHEMADRVARVLEDTGLVSGFARLIVLLGHGSSSLNNPHESAYACGACGGRRGGPNARLFATMANDVGVRSLLRARGIDLPDSTWFVGGEHDTASDSVTYFDRELVPVPHHEALRHFEEALDRARTANAHERCRRFMSIATTATLPEALAHVEARADDLAEPRPECGHATNAVCIVGRRGLTRGLFLDRRAFLVSYDPTVDHDEQTLSRVLAAITPVCAGINLEYYFSHVDNEGYGAGTKLPHNVVGLLGVMNGATGDLRTGLPWQMVEIHDPVRLLMVLETTPEGVRRVFERNADFERLVRNRWFHLAIVSPRTGETFEYVDGAFVPVAIDAHGLSTVERSIDWYLGNRDHLPIAFVRSSGALTASDASSELR